MGTGAGRGVADTHPGGAMRSARSTLLIAVAAAPAAIVVVGGLTSTALQSVGLLPFVGPPTFSTAAYESLADDVAGAAALSLAIAGASTIIAVIVGTTIALVVMSGGWTSRALAGLSAATVTVPHLVGAAAIGLLLADSGVIARVLHIPAGAWPSFVGGPWWSSVILEYAWKESAFVALVVAGTLVTRVARFDETAAVLGAGRRTRVRLVLLPLARPSIIIAGIIGFVYILGSYEVAWLLGRTYPEPLSVMALRLYGDVGLTARPLAAAVAMTIVGISAAASALAFTALRRSAAWR